MDLMSTFLFFVILVLGIIILLGKGYDQGSSTDRERTIYSDGPECGDDENLAKICSPFDYEHEREHEDIEQPLIECGEKEIATTLQSNVTDTKTVLNASLREVKLNDFVDNKTNKAK